MYDKTLFICVMFVNPPISNIRIDYYLKKNFYNLINLKNYQKSIIVQKYCILIYVSPQPSHIEIFYSIP